MNEADEHLRQKEATARFYRLILSNFLYDMALGEKTEFLKTDVYKAFFEKFVKANIEYGKAQYEKILHR